LDFYFIFNFLKRGKQNRTEQDKSRQKADKNKTKQNKQINERAEHTDKRADKGLGGD